MTGRPGTAGAWTVRPDTSPAGPGPDGLAVVGVFQDGTLARARGGGPVHWVPVPDGVPWPLVLRRAAGPAPSGSDRPAVPLLRAAHPVAVTHPGDRAGVWWVVWGEVHHRHTGPRVTGSPDGDPFTARITELVAADRAAGVPAERWYRDNAAYLGATYLAAETEFGQSGKAGDAAEWELGRRVVARAVDRGGAFLDIGCANGLLLASLLDWTSADIEPFGLDIVPGLVDLARARLPRHSANLWCGNAADWAPPRRFDYVHTLLEYVPPDGRCGYVHRLVADFLAPGGRLIVSDYGRDPGTPSVGALLAGWGLGVAGAARQDRGPDRRPVEVTWVDKPGGGRG